MIHRGSCVPHADDEEGRATPCDRVVIDDFAASSVSEPLEDEPVGTTAIDAAIAVPAPNRLLDRRTIDQALGASSLSMRRPNEAFYRHSAPR